MITYFLFLIYRTITVGKTSLLGKLRVIIEIMSYLTEHQIGKMWVLVTKIKIGKNIYRYTKPNLSQGKILLFDTEIKIRKNKYQFSNQNRIIKKLILTFKTTIIEIARN